MALSNNPIAIDDVSADAFNGLTANAHRLAVFGWVKSPLLDRYTTAVESLTVTSRKLNKEVANGAMVCGLHVVLAGMHAVIDFADAPA